MEAAMSDDPITTVDAPVEAPQRPPLRLRGNRDRAIEVLKNQLKISSAIRDQRLRDMWELSHARAEKQEWVTRNTELLNELFNSTQPAEFCNDWVGPVLPEYAEFGLFAE